MPSGKSILNVTVLFVCGAGVLLGLYLMRDPSSVSVEILRSTPRWMPFFQEGTRFHEPLQSYDDGSLVLTYYPDLEGADLERHLQTAAEEALRAGWVKASASSVPSKHSRHWTSKKRARLLKMYGASDAPRYYFTYHQLHWDPEGRQFEVVELIPIEETGGVVFVSHYAYNKPDDLGEDATGSTGY